MAFGDARSKFQIISKASQAKNGTYCSKKKNYGTNL